MVNFEIFTGKHHLLPRTQHVNLFGKIMDELQNLDSEFIDYYKLTKTRFDNFKLDVSSSYQGDHLENNRRMVFRMNYMYKLKKDTEDMKADILEIFSSIQGEGLRIGERQIFIRFHGCNLNCAYCDVDMSKDPDKMDIKGVLEKIDILNLNRIHNTIAITLEN